MVKLVVQESVTVKPNPLNPATVETAVGAQLASQPSSVKGVNVPTNVGFVVSCIVMVCVAIELLLQVSVMV